LFFFFFASLKQKSFAVIRAEWRTRLSPGVVTKLSYNEKKKTNGIRRARTALRGASTKSITGAYHRPTCTRTSGSSILGTHHPADPPLWDKHATTHAATVLFVLPLVCFVEIKIKSN
jgi:hypothetical protein